MFAAMPIPGVAFPHAWRVAPPYDLPDALFEEGR